MSSRGRITLEHVPPELVSSIIRFVAQKDTAEWLLALLLSCKQVLYAWHTDEPLRLDVMQLRATDLRRADEDVYISWHIFDAENGVGKNHQTRGFVDDMGNRDPSQPSCRSSGNALVRKHEEGYVRGRCVQYIAVVYRVWQIPNHEEIRPFSSSCMRPIPS
jgi:hypothetical protein